MSTVSPSSPTLSLWHPRGEQALQVATLLRGAPMTLLFGDRGAGKTTLLMQGVLPLLRRRWADLRSDAWQAERSSADVQPERRRGAWHRRREIALYIDTWTDAVRDALRMRVEASNRPGQDGAPQPEWLLLFDRYEDHLRTSNSSTQAFDSWLMRHLSNAASCVHVLMSLDSDAEPQLLQRYDPRLVRLSNHYLRLLPVRHGSQDPPPMTLEAPAAIPALALVSGTSPLPIAQRPADPLSAAPVATASSPLAEPEVAPAANPAIARTAVDAAARHAPSEPIDAIAQAEPEASVPRAPLEEPAPAPTSLSDVLDLPATSRAAPSRPRKPTSPVQPVELRWSAPGATTVDVGNLAAAAAAAVPHQHPASAKPHSALLWALAITALAAGLWWAYAEQYSGRATGAGAATVEAPSDSNEARAALLPAWQLWAGTEDGARSPLTDDLLQFVAPAAGMAMTAHVHSGGVAGLAALSGAGRLAIARQDALRAAHARPDQPPLQVVMPLYTEEIYLLVRADSPLRYAHQMRGRVINIGPIDGPRALTAQTLYRDLFGTSLPMTHSATLDRDAALTAMIAGDAIDVLVLVGAQPDAWLAGLPQQTLKQLRPLTLDANEPVTRRVLQTYGAGALHAAEHPGWLQGDVPVLSVQSYLITPESPDVTVALQVGELARALCRALPGLQLSGHPKWNEVQPGRQVAVGWPYAPIAAGAIGACLAAADDAPKTAAR